MVKKLILLFTLILAGLTSCDRNSNFSVISVEEDVKLGQQITAEVIENPNQFPVLDPNAYPESYAYLNNIVTNILESGNVAYQEEFPWKVYIIKDDTTLNAFATPGGYIFVYSGLIKFLDTEDDLAGVLGHEIAHADLRHASRQIQKAYGLNLVLNLVLGSDESGVLGKIVGQLAGQLAGLKFSREYESEADAKSVEYLANTPYQCNAAETFFIKLKESEKQGNIPTFLSTHPHPENRIEAIEEKAKQVGCLKKENIHESNYKAFKKSLP